ncbi:MAG: DinB family protein [Frankiaceae bacterium]
MDEKQILLRYLRVQRRDLLSKLDGLDDYDIRRPMTATGTNLLGLVKHVASVELGYFGDVFGRPSGRELPWLADGAEPDADLWVAPGETREDLVELHRFAAAHSDATIEALPLDATGEVPWWPAEHGRATLRTVLLHVCVEIARHAGHADVIRELIDGMSGRRPGDPSLSDRTPEEWASHRARIEAAARQAVGR